MKKIRSNIVKESLLDYETFANTLKENTSNAVKDLLSETVREAYSKILSEEDENEYEEEVEDTEVENNTEETPDDFESEGTEDDSADFEGSETEGEDDVVDGDNVSDDTVTDDELGNDVTAEEGSEEDAWKEFDKYKVEGSDDVYNFSQAKDEDIVKVYKLLKDDDEVLVNVDKDSNKVEIKDNETGAEYLLDLGSQDSGVIEDGNDDIDAEGDLDYNEDMNESRIFEIALNEYDSNVGYTDNYQSKDVMTNPGMSEPGKNVNDWDKGVPHDTAKPWSGKKGGKKEDQPFHGEKGKKVEESYIFEIETDDVSDLREEDAIEEGAGRFGMVQKHTKAKKHVGTNDGEDNEPEISHSLSTSEKGYKAQANVAESRMIAQHNKIVKENKQLKTLLNKFKNVLSEAAVTNKNLGQIIKLISENSTTKAEKQEIIARFGKEANTIESSDKLYESISRELRKNATMNINEEKQFTTNGSKMINETQIYQSKDLLDSLDLMHRLCK